MTKRSNWKYQPTQTRTVRSKFAPKLMLVDNQTGVVWLYNYESLMERLDPNTDPNVCHLNWKGSGHRQGYGLFHVFRKNDPAAKNGQMNIQRLIKAIELDRPLKKEEQVYATCGNLLCTNKNHLKVGSKVDCYVNAHKGVPSLMMKFPKEWIIANINRITTTKVRVLAQELGITNNQAHYLRIVANKNKPGAIEVIDLRKRKS